jgi:hypothetical protein
MAAMIVTTEVEATPELISAALVKFMTATAGQQFKYSKGSLLILEPSHLAALNGVEGMPVLVLSNPPGILLGMVAIYTQAGSISMAFIAEIQVLSQWIPE